MVLCLYSKFTKSNEIVRNPINHQELLELPELEPVAIHRNRMKNQSRSGQKSKDFSAAGGEVDGERRE